MGFGYGQFNMFGLADMGRQYLGAYLNQGSPFMGMCVPTRSQSFCRGAYVADFALGIFTQIFSGNNDYGYYGNYGNYGGGGGGSAAPKQTVAETRSEKIDKLNAELRALDAKKKAPEKEIDSKYQSDIDTANKNLSAAKTKQTELSAKITALGAQIKELEAETPKDENKIAELKRQKTEYEAEQTQIIASISNLEAKVKEAEAAKMAAIADFVHGVDLNIQKLEKEIKALDRAQKAEQADKELDEADGGVLNRIGGKENATARRYIRKFRLAKQKYDAIPSDKKAERAAQAHVLQGIATEMREELPDYSIKKLRDEVKTGYNYVNNWKPDED